MKSGDLVRCVDAADSGRLLVKGREYQVIGTTSSGEVYLNLTGTIPWHHKRFQLIKDNPMTIFKVGDKVQVVDTGGNPSARLGDTGTVVDIRGESGKYDTILMVSRDGDEQSIDGFEYRFTLIKQEKPMTIFKVGDKVQVIDIEGNPNSKLGDIGTVTEVDSENHPSDGHFLDVTRDRDGQSISAYQYRFKSIKDKPMTRLRVGDKVEPLNPDDWMYPEYIVSGKCYLSGYIQVRPLYKDREGTGNYHSPKEFKLIKQEKPVSKSLEQQIQATQAQLESLQQALAESQTPKPWPQLGDEYWTISTHGVMSKQQVTREDPDSFDQRVIALGNAYRTKREAEQQVAKLRARTRLLVRIKELNQGWEPEFHDFTGKAPMHLNYTLSYSKPEGWSIDTFRWVQHLPASHYFKSKEIGEQLLTEFTSQELTLALL